MKIAGILAILLSVVLGIWCISDYSQNESARQQNVDSQIREVTRELDGAPQDDEPFVNGRDIEHSEQFDGGIGIVAAIALIGGIAMLAKSGKHVDSKESESSLSILQ